MKKHELHIRFPRHLESDSAHFWIINPEIFTVDNRWERQIYFLNKTISKHLKAVRGCLSSPVKLFSTGCSYLTDPTYRTMVLHPSEDGLFHSEEKTTLGPRCTRDDTTNKLNCINSDQKIRIAGMDTGNPDFCRDRKIQIGGEIQHDLSKQLLPPFLPIEPNLCRPQNT